MKTVNLGILAHVDAGKTSLTERLLHAAGVIDEVGSVDDGSTQTDSLALERQRGITIKSAVVSFVLDDVTVNLIDTPGHSDFIAEVERVLSVLDGAVLVISAVEGVQAQTRVLMRALQRLRIPTLLFVNKIDRSGADDERVLREIADRLTPAVVPMGAASSLGTKAAGFTAYRAADPTFTDRLVEVLVEQDDDLLAAAVDQQIPPARLREELVAQTGRAQVHPVFFGSAITGAGVGPLIDALTQLLPTTSGDADAPVSGTVFKVDRGAAGERIAFARLFSGTVSVRDVLHLGRDSTAKVTSIGVFERGSTVRVDSFSAGRIARLWGLGAVRIGDVIGEPGGPTRAEHHFTPPSLETVVDPRRPSDKGALHAALSQLAEQDPLINLRQDDQRNEISVSLYGEVQKEVIEATLAQGFGVEVTFRETSTICIERPVASGAALELIGEDPNPYLATVGLRLDPAPVDSGIEFRLEVELGSMPPAFFTAVEEAARETLAQGLHGWEVRDCTVTMTHSGYWARQSHSHGTFDASMSSTSGAFRNLTRLVVADALTHSGTTVLEPMHHFDLRIPHDVLGPALSTLAQVRAVPQETDLSGASYLLSGVIPADRVHELQLLVPTLTRGEGELLSAFDHYEPVHGPTPTRLRTDLNPLDRVEYVRRIARRA